jgi:uncharacterized protein YdgA (DUF945 family)
VKRWVVVLLVGLAVLLLISPGIIGRMTQSSLEDSIELARIESPEITISTESFDRGWFSSVGRHRIELSDRGRFPELASFVDQAGYNGMPALILDSRIDHGLVPLGSLSREEGSLEPGLANLTSTVQLDPGSGELIDLPGRINSAIGLSGATNADLLLEEGNWSDGDTRIDWKGAQIEMVLDSTGVMTAADGFIDAVRFSAGGRKVESSRIDVTMTQEKSDYDFMVGSMNVRSDGVSVSDITLGNQVGFASMDISVASKIVDDRISGSSDIDLAGIITPGLGTIDIAMDLEYSGFDAASFVLLYSALQEAAADGNPEDAFAAIYPAMDAELQQFLTAGGDIQINHLKLLLPLGDILADFHFTLPEAGPGDAFSWPGLLLKLKASINLQLPDSLFQMIEAAQPEAGAAVAMGILVLEGNQYKMQLEYAQGLATINGVPMPVPLPGS